MAIAVYPPPGPARKRDAWDVIGAVILIVMIAVVIGVAIWALVSGHALAGL